jgi:S1-C subfamily serine protease
MTDQPRANQPDESGVRSPDTYPAPYAQPTYWAPRTPDHWLEPLPDQRRRRPRRRSRVGLLAAMAVVALVAGAVGAGGMYLALDMRGGLAGAAPLATLPSPTPMAVVTAAPPTVTPADMGAVARVAETVSPAVVTITALAGEAEDPFILPESGVGSGVIFEPSGWILTNRHVVADVLNVRVQLNDRRELAGTVYGVDTLTDLAIVKIDGTDLPSATIGDSEGLRPGQLAVAIGSPLGTFTNSVTSGVISALGRNNVPVTDAVTGLTRRLNNLIQTDAAINPGNSGGPLVNERGEVIGVNTAVATGAQGIGFAIPINIAKPLMRQAVAGEELQRPWIGITYVPVDRNVADQNELAIDYGVWIVEGQAQPAIFPGSPAAAADLQVDDIITAINGRRVDANNTLEEILSGYEPGDELTLMVLRNGEALQVELTLGVRPAASP